MNEGESHLHPWIEPELEARIIALVLGEASDFESEELNRLIDERPELAMFRKRMEAIHGLLHEVAAGESEDADDTWKLSDERRDAVLAAIENGSVEAEPASEKTHEPDAAGAASDFAEDPEPVIEEMPLSKTARERGRMSWKRILSFSAAACLLLFAGFAALMQGNLGSRSAPLAELAWFRKDEADYVTSAEAPRSDHYTEKVEDGPDSTHWSWGGESKSTPLAVVALTDGAETAAVTLDDALSLASVSQSNAASSSLSKLNETLFAFPVTPAAPVSTVSGFDAAELPPLVSPTRDLKLNVAEDLEIADSGNRGITIKGFSRPDTSGTSMKTELSFPKAKGGTDDFYARIRERSEAGQPGAKSGDRAADAASYDILVTAVNDVNLEENRRAKLDSPMEAADRAVSEFEGQLRQNQLERRIQSRGEDQLSWLQSQGSEPSGFAMGMAKHEPASGPRPKAPDVPDVPDKNGDGIVPLQVEPAGVNVGGALTANGGTVGGVIELSTGGVNLQGSVSADGRGGMGGGGGRMDGEKEPESRSKRELGEGRELGQAIAGTAATKRPAPVASAKPALPKLKPTGGAVTEEFGIVADTASVMSGPAAAAEESKPETVFGLGGLIEVSGKQALNQLEPSTATRTGSLPVRPAAAPAAANKGLSRDVDAEESMPAGEAPRLAIAAKSRDGGRDGYSASRDREKSEAAGAESLRRESERKSGEEAPPLGDVPMLGRMFRQGEGDESARGFRSQAATEIDKLADLTAVPGQTVQRYGDFDNGMGNSIEKPGEGNSHSLFRKDAGGDRFFAGESMDRDGDGDAVSNGERANGRRFAGAAAGANPVDPQAIAREEMAFRWAETPADAPVAGAVRGTAQAQAQPANEVNRDWVQSGKEQAGRELGLGFDSKKADSGVAAGKKDGETKFSIIPELVDEERTAAPETAKMFGGVPGGDESDAAPSGGPAPAKRPVIAGATEKVEKESLAYRSRAPGSIANSLADEQLAAGGQDRVAGFGKSAEGARGMNRPASTTAPVAPEPSPSPENRRSVTLDAVDGSVQNTGSIEAKGKNGSGGEIFVDANGTVAMNGPAATESLQQLSAVVPENQTGEDRLVREQLVAGEQDEKSLMKRKPALKAMAEITADKASVAHELKELEDLNESLALMDVSDARGGGKAIVGGGVQEQVEQLRTKITADQAGENHGAGIEATLEERKAHGNVYSLSVNNRGAIDVLAAETAEAEGGVTNGEVQVTRSSLAAIKDALGSQRELMSENVESAGETVTFGEGVSKIEDLASFQTVTEAEPEIRNEISPPVQNPQRNKMKGRAGKEFEATVTPGEPWYFKGEKLNPNVHAGGATWDVPVAGGDIDRDLGRFRSAQQEWQRYPGQPAAAANPGPVSAEGEEDRETSVLWSSGSTRFAGDISATKSPESTPGFTGSHYGYYGLNSELQVDDAKREEINAATDGWTVIRGDGREGKKSKSGATRKWREGFDLDKDGLYSSMDEFMLGNLEEIDLSLSPEIVEFEGFINYGASMINGRLNPSTNDSKSSVFRSGANAIDGDSIDPLITDLRTTVAARNGQRGNLELTREFIYPNEYNPPEVPEKIALKKRVAPPSGLEEKNAAEESFSTFSLHVSDVSFKLAQAALAKGEWPEAGKVRIEEFVNAFDYGDPNPSQDDKVACRVEQAIHPFLQQRNLMRVAMRTAAAGRAGDTPLRLTFLLDNSGSMERADREETVRRAFALLADQLQPIDQVTLISFARQPRLLADKVSGDKSRELVEVVANLPSEGGTNLEAALQLAFEKAQEQKTDNAQNRIVLLTDGAANLGNAKPESLARMVESMREEGIAFDAAGIGAEGLNDEILEALTRKGDGRYYLLDRPEDADAGFARQIAGALRPAAKNVKVQVEFNPDRIDHYKLLGFEKHLLKKEDFRNDAVDAAEMAAEEAGVAVYQFEAKPGGKGDVGFVSVRFRDMSSGEMVEKRWPIPYEPSVARLDQAAPSMRIATTAALLAAKLNSEPLGETVDLDDLARTVSSLPGSFQNKERVQQLRQMIDQARGLASK